MTYQQGECLVPLAGNCTSRITVILNPQQEGAVALGARVRCRQGERIFRNRVRDVIETARATLDNPAVWLWNATVHFDPLPEPGDRGWELAAVIADRIALGLLAKTANPPTALGYSEDWLGGRILALDAYEYIRRLCYQKDQPNSRLYLAASEHAAVTTETQAHLGNHPDTMILTHLGDLHGHPDPVSRVRSARIWFPLIGGGPHLDQLARIEVAAVPWDPATRSQAGQETIHIQDTGDRQARTIIEVLQAARQRDGGRAGYWRTIVQFSRVDFQDRSYELALVLADRIARGREPPATGRLIASGCSDHWETGEIRAVDHLADKLSLCLRQAEPGDRLLIPHVTLAGVPIEKALADAIRPLREQGTVVAGVERIC